MCIYRIVLRELFWKRTMDIPFSMVRIILNLNLLFQ